MPKKGFISATFKETNWKRLEIVAKIKGFKSVQKMIYKNYLGVSR